MAEENGARLFEPCRACHSLDPAARGLPGPNLAGLAERLATMERSTIPPC